MPTKGLGSTKSQWTTTLKSEDTALPSANHIGWHHLQKGLLLLFFVVYFVASMVSKWFGRNQRKVGTKNPEDFQKGTCASGARFHRWWPLKLAKDSSSYSMYYTGYTTVVVVVVFAYGKIVSDSYIWPIDISIKVINNKTEKKNNWIFQAMNASMIFKWNCDDAFFL